MVREVLIDVENAICTVSEVEFGGVGHDGYKDGGVIEF